MTASRGTNRWGPWIPATIRDGILGAPVPGAQRGTGHPGRAGCFLQSDPTLFRALSAELSKHVVPVELAGLIAAVTLWYPFRTSTLVRAVNVRVSPRHHDRNPII